MEHSGACLLGASFMFVCASTCWYYLGRSSGWGVRRGFHCDQAGASLSSSLLSVLAPFQTLFLLTWRPLNMADFYLNERLSHFFLEKSWPQSYAAWANFFFSICVWTFRIYKHGIFGTESFLISSCSLSVVRYLVVCWLHLQKYNHQAIWYPLKNNLAFN